MVKRILCGALGLLLCLCACEKGPSAPQLLEPVSIGSDLTAVEIGDIYDGKVFEGSVLPELEELEFSTSGRVEEICIVMGETVKAGDPLIRLDTKALQDRVDDLADRLDYARTMDGFSSREADLRRESLAQQFGESSATYRLYDNEQTSAAQTRAEEIADLEKQLAEAEEDLNVKSVVTSPCDGTVAAMYVKVGDWAMKEKPAALVADDSRCRLQTEYIGETASTMANAVYAMVGGVRYEVEYLPVDMSEFITATLAGKTLHSNFALKNGSSDLIGQYALLYLMTFQREQVLSIPANALMRDAEGSYVYVDEGGKRVRRNVETGLKTPAQVEILSGLEEGENVYVVG